MNFSYILFLPLVIIIFLIIAYFVIKQETKAFLWIEKYWFYKRTTLNKISSVLFLVAIFFFLISLLDLRGSSQNKKAILPDQKTIIIVDSSASMLVEDVRPNRFLKSLLMARHFIKRAYGHQIAVVLFSDNQKRIIPFTDDLELLDSRIEGLEKKMITRGGSNVTQAISESIQYFKEVNKSKDSPTGNILLFTDSDENRGDFELNVPDGITLGVVAVATRAGGPIPLKDQKGSFFGYKNFKGEKVISKLDESFLIELKDKVKNYRYWEITTYNLPTDEILNFFNSIFKNKISEKNIDIRPVYTQYLVIFAIFLYVFSVLFSRGKNLAFMIILFLIPFFPPIAAEKKTEQLMSKFKTGKLNSEGVLKLAEKLLTENKAKQAAILYEEVPTKKDIAAIINYGTALVLSGKIDQGLAKYKDLMAILESSKSPQKEIYLNYLRNNVLMALKQDEKQKQKQKEEQEKKNKEKEKSSSKDKDGEGENQEESKENEKQDKENQKKEDKEQKGKDKNKEESDSLDDKHQKIKEAKEKVKLPAMIKQILDDDRKLQQQYLDTSTQKRNQPEEAKDW